jgi:hypothetical protein
MPLFQPYSSCQPSSADGSASGNEIRSISLTPSTAYYVVVTNSSFQFYNVTANAWTAPADLSADNWADHGVAMTEAGLPGAYTANFPTAITTAATYDVFVYLRLTAAPLITDPAVQQGTVKWDGARERT